MAEKPLPETDKRRPANHIRVLDVLRQAGCPLSAYDIIDRLRDDGVTAPTTVYRALNRLIDTGAVHRLDSLSAFVACTHPEHAGTAVFAICRACREVTEIEDAAFSQALADCAARAAFQVERTTVEIQGLCARCADIGARETRQ